jgi:type II secretion system protein J
VLQRERYAVLDRTAGTRPNRDDLLDRVQALEWRYLAADGRELAQWPPPRANTEVAPRAVLLSLTLEDYGEIRRVFELPEEARP